MADEIKKPNNMLELMELSIARTEKRLVDTFREICESNPDVGIPRALHTFHMAMIRTLQKSETSDALAPVLGFISALLLPNLTEEEKEALRNDTL